MPAELASAFAHDGQKRDVISEDDDMLPLDSGRQTLHIKAECNR